MTSWLQRVVIGKLLKVSFKRKNILDESWLLLVQYKWKTSQTMRKCFFHWYSHSYFWKERGKWIVFESTNSMNLKFTYFFKLIHFYHKNASSFHLLLFIQNWTSQPSIHQNYTTRRWFVIISSLCKWAIANVRVTCFEKMY